MAEKAHPGGKRKMAFMYSPAVAMIEKGAEQVIV
jgi:hypothetical protein